MSRSRATSALGSWAGRCRTVWWWSDPYVCVVGARGEAVKNGNGLQVTGGCEFTNPYHISCSPCENTWWSWFGLPSLTIVPIRVCLHSFDLYHLHLRLHGDWVIDCYNVLIWLGHMIDCGEYPTWLVVEAVFDAVGLGLAICFECDMSRRMILVMYWVWLVLD